MLAPKIPIKKVRANGKIDFQFLQHMNLSSLQKFKPQINTNENIYENVHLSLPVVLSFEKILSYFL